MIDYLHQIRTNYKDIHINIKLLYKDGLKYFIHISFI